MAPGVLRVAILDIDIGLRPHGFRRHFRLQIGESHNVNTGVLFSDNFGDAVDERKETSHVRSFALIDLFAFRALTGATTISLGDMDEIRFSFLFNVFQQNPAQFSRQFWICLAMLPVGSALSVAVHHEPLRMILEIGLSGNQPRQRVGKSHRLIISARLLLYLSIRRICAVTQRPFRFEANGHKRLAPFQRRRMDARTGNETQRRFRQPFLVQVPIAIA